MASRHWSSNSHEYQNGINEQNNVINDWSPSLPPVMALLQPFILPLTACHQAVTTVSCNLYRTIRLPSSSVRSIPSTEEHRHRWYEGNRSSIRINVRSGRNNGSRISFPNSPHNIIVTVTGHNHWDTFIISNTVSWPTTNGLN